MNNLNSLSSATLALKVMEGWISSSQPSRIIHFTPQLQHVTFITFPSCCL